MLPRQNVRIRFSGYILNPADRSVQTKNGERVLLSETECEVLFDLLEAKGEGVARKDFTPWRGKGTNPARHPVDNHIAALRAKLDDKLITPIPKIGHALSRGINVEVIPYGALSKADVLGEIAEKHTDTHAGPDLLATIANCENIIKMGNAGEETHLKLARAYLNAGHDGFCLLHWREAVEKARSAIADAFALNPYSSSAHGLQGLIKLTYDYAWQSAEKELQAALDLDQQESMAHVFYAHLLVSRGDFERGLEHIRTGVELAPTDRITVSTEPWMYYLAHRYDEAIAKGIEVTSLFPSFPQAKLFLGWAYQATGDTEKAIEEYEKALDREFLTEALASLGNAYAELKKDKAALALLKELDRAKSIHKIAYVSAYNRAMLLAGFGNRKKKDCLGALEYAFKQRSSWLVYLNVEPRLDSLRGEADFKSLVRRVGLTP
jgi:tetratricopeptide (TPR) repeat protein